MKKKKLKQQRDNARAQNKILQKTLALSQRALTATPVQVTPPAVNAKEPVSYQRLGFQAQLFVAACTLLIFFSQNSSQVERSTASYRQTKLTFANDSLSSRVLYYDKNFPVLNDSIHRLLVMLDELNRPKTTFDENVSTMQQQSIYELLRGFKQDQQQGNLSKSPPDNARKTPYEPLIDSTIVVTDEEITAYVERHKNTDMFMDQIGGVECQQAHY